MFANKHLYKLGIQVQDLAKQFQDGSAFLLLIGKLGNFFIPLQRYYLSPSSAEEKLHNVLLAIRLLSSMGLSATKWNAQGTPFVGGQNRTPHTYVAVIQGDSKVIMRILFDMCQTFQRVE